MIRQLLNHAGGQPTPYPAHEIDSRLIAGLPTNKDAIEGVMSFLEKRPPVFATTVESGLPEWLPGVNVTGK